MTQWSCCFLFEVKQSHPIKKKRLLFILTENHTEIWEIIFRPV